jgi:hypothetical protein
MIITMTIIMTMIGTLHRGMPGMMCISDDDHRRRPSRHI